jgi:hypothetical protein
MIRGRVGGVSSIEPDDSGGEADGGEEISHDGVAAGGGGPELPESAEEILDRMTRLVEVAIKLAAPFDVAGAGSHPIFRGPPAPR